MLAPLKHCDPKLLQSWNNMKRNLMQVPKDLSEALRFGKSLAEMSLRRQATKAEGEIITKSRGGRPACWRALKKRCKEVIIWRAFQMCIIDI
jgi:hypothetical protein